MRRAYATAAVRVRLHQRAFRERVLRAYRQQCAFCRFRHPELLDAAHILPDSDPGGEPVVRNGLALCTLHHGKFDRLFLGVRPDDTIEVRPDILREEDRSRHARARHSGTTRGPDINSSELHLIVRILRFWRFAITNSVTPSIGRFAAALSGDRKTTNRPGNRDTRPLRSSTRSGPDRVGSYVGRSDPQGT